MLSTRLTGSSTSITWRVQAQRRVQRGVGAGRGRSARRRTPGSTSSSSSHSGCELPRQRRRAGGRRTTRRTRRRPSARHVRQRRVPVVAGEDLVGALPGLHHLDVLRHLLAEQVEGDAVVADHRLAHRRDGAVARPGSEPLRADPDLVVVGAELLGDQVGVVELVAALAGRRLEADAEGGQAALALLGQQRHDRLESSPPESSTPTGTSATIRRSTAVRSARQTALRPVLGGHGARGGRVYDRLPVDACRCSCRPARSIRTVAGGSLRTPARIVRGARHHRVEASCSGAAPPGRATVSTSPAASSAGRVEAKRSRPGRLGQVQRLDAEPVAGQDHGAAWPCSTMAKANMPRKCSTQRRPSGGTP